MTRKLKIAVFSSAYHSPEKEHTQMAVTLGKYLAEKECLVMTGGCIGLPSQVAQSAQNHGAETIAYYPDISEKELIKNQKIHNNDIKGIYSEKKYYEGFTQRSIEMIKDADAAIVFNGRLGTLSEFTVGVEEGLAIGVIEGSGGVSNEIRNLCKIVGRDLDKSNIFIHTHYKKVIDEVMKGR